MKKSTWCRALTFISLMLILSVSLSGCAIPPLLATILSTLATSLLGPVGGVIAQALQPKATPAKTPTRTPTTKSAVLAPRTAPSRMIAPSEEVPSQPIKAIRPIRPENP